MSLRSIALMLCLASLLGCAASESKDNEMQSAGAGGIGDAANHASASGQGGTSGQAGTGSMTSGGIGGVAGVHTSAGGGAGGEGGDPSSLPDAGDDEPTNAELAAADRSTLLTCDAPEPCPPAGAGLTENQYFPQPASKYECLFNALAARTPGFYRYTTGHTWTNGSWSAEHALLVLDGGEVLYALAASGSYSAQPGESVPIDGSLTGRRCALKPASYFEDCLAAMMTVDSAAITDPAALGKARQCVMSGEVSPGPVAWIESCHEESPVACE